MKGIKIPIYYHTDQTEILHNIGVDSNIEEYEIRDVIFYSVIAISPRDENGKECTTIHANGDTFISPLNVKEVDKKIEQL